LELTLNITKPTVLDVMNEQIRYLLTTFLPPDAPSPFIPTTTLSPDYYNEYYQYEDGRVNAVSQVRIPSKTEQVEALVNFVRFQIPWLIGDPLILPDIVMNFGIAELHNITINRLSNVTKVQRLSFIYDGRSFTISTKFYHEKVYNRHRVVWFPSSLLSTSQWTEAYMGLIKTKTVLVLDKRLLTPPKLTSFSVRPVVFDPSSQNGATRVLDRVSRTLLDSIRTDFGDSIHSFLYSPLVTRINAVLNSVDARTNIKNFVCYGAQNLP